MCGFNPRIINPGATIKQMDAQLEYFHRRVKREMLMAIILQLCVVGMVTIATFYLFLFSRML